MHFLVLSAGKLLDKSEETHQAAFLLHVLPGVELAGGSCFVDCPLCALPSDGHPSTLSQRDILQSYMCSAKRSNMLLSLVAPDLVSFAACLCTVSPLQHRFSHCKQSQSNFRCSTTKTDACSAAGLRLTSNLTLLVSMKQLQALIKAADVCYAARMR